MGFEVISAASVSRTPSRIVHVLSERGILTVAHVVLPHVAVMVWWVCTVQALTRAVTTLAATQFIALEWMIGPRLGPVQLSMGLRQTLPAWAVPGDPQPHETRHAPETACGRAESCGPAAGSGGALPRAVCVGAGVARAAHATS